MSVINLDAVRNEREKADSDFCFNVTVWRTQDGAYWGTLGDEINPVIEEEATSDNPDHADAEVTHKIAQILRAVAYQADAVMAELPGGQDLLATVLIYGNSRVSTVCNDRKVKTEEQHQWLDERLDEAKEALRP